MQAKDAVFYAIPVALLAVAAGFAWRAHRDAPPPPREGEVEPPRVSMCPAGRARCAHAEILITTGLERPGAAPPCEERSAGRCARACVTESVALEGVAATIAREQLCDAPVDVAPWIEREQTIAELGEDGGVCTADGWGPSEDGVLECILRSAKDPDALGVVVHRVRCRTGVIDVSDTTPRLLQRDQAIALWCKREGAGLGVGLDAAGSSDAVTDSLGDGDGSTRDARDAD